MYDKEQSRRVPAVRAKPGNPGYGFRRARWRNTMEPGDDRRYCESILRSMEVSQERIDRIRRRIADFRDEWDNVRRPSRPAGPGRPRGHKRATAADASADSATAAAAAEPASAPAAAANAPASSTPRKPKKAAKAKAPPPDAVPTDSLWHDPTGQGPHYNGAVPPVGGPPPAAGEEAEWARAGKEDLLVPVGHWDVSDDGHHAHTLVEENSSLRSLNMSLIYEREKLLRELREWDADMQQIERSVEGLLRGASPHRDAAELSEAFRWLSTTLFTKGRGTRCDVPDLSPHLKLALEACCDSYDEHQNSTHPGDVSGGNHAQGHHPRTRDVLLAAAAEDPEGAYAAHSGAGLSPSEDLRADLAAARWQEGAAPKRARATPTHSDALPLRSDALPPPHVKRERAPLPGDVAHAPHACAAMHMLAQVDSLAAPFGHIPGQLSLGHDEAEVDHLCEADFAEVGTPPPPPSY
jgi:hypothetical protein